MIAWIALALALLLLFGNMARSHRLKMLEREIALLYLNEDLLFDQVKRVSGQSVVRHRGSRYETQEYLEV